MEEDSSLNKVMQDSLQDLDLDQVLQDQHSPESLKQDQEQQSLHSGLDQVQVQDKDSIQAEEGHHRCPPDPPQDPLEVPEGDQTEQSQDLVQKVDLDRVSPQDQDQDQDQEAAGESGGSVPALVITQAEEPRGPGPAAGPAEPRSPQRPADLVTPLSPAEPSLSSSSDGGDMACSDLLSLRSDSLSLASEPTVSRTSEDDDNRSVAASSVMTALHWAAKQGRQEAVDMMLRSGADVNARSGYTALHLASIHGHQHVVHALINTHSAKTSLRDYHGRTAAQYWSGGSDAFHRPDCQPGPRFSRGRQTQRYALPSLLLSRSRSQGQLNLDFGTVPQSVSQDPLDLQI
ncbi:uncharacterized protein LOC143322671 [Chaetodon auriga]|uniref:uncharacterized protein LOC143322671 n=1 Tax=Chaetodon auriga TaxID=39042 RepID=UPI004032B0A2